MEFARRLLSAFLICTYLSVFVYTPVSMAADPVANNMVCGQDLNNNGYLGDEGEYQSCLTSTVPHSTDASSSCLPGYTMQPNGICMMYEYAPLGDSCAAGYFIQNGRCLKEENLEPQAYCPSGYTVVGNGCQKVSYTTPTNSCPSGSIIQNGRCITQTQTTPTTSCRAGTTPDRYNGQAACGWVWTNGHPNYSTPSNPVIGVAPTTAPNVAIAFIKAEFICSKGTLSNGKCIVSTDTGPVTLVCSTGSTLVNGQCQSTSTTNLNYLCQVGTYTNGKCNVVTDGGPVKAVCQVGYVIENGKCVKSSESATQYSCAQGTLNGTKCEWNTSDHYCPIGVDQSCLKGGGGASCSPNKCVDITQNKPVDEGNVDGTQLVDDGEKSEDGVCLDQIYIFNGRGADCKLAGVSTAFKNCCKSEGKVYSDDVGPYSTVLQAASTVKNVYAAAQEAYLYYTVAMEATADAAIAGSMAADAFVNAMMASMNPATIAIAIAIHFIMEYLMKACDQMSMETAMEAGSGMCHEVGTYCKKKVPLLGCVQKATSYCCFNSILARIIQEQGRPQLTTFNGWGTPEAPQCRGFTPEEFQQLDFSKINLDEYVQTMVKAATSEIQDSVTTITQSFYDKTN